EEEGVLAGVANDTLATAQNLAGAVGAVPTAQAGVWRGAVLGQTDNTAAAVTPTFVDISSTGTVSTATGDDSAQVLSGAQLAGFTFPFFGAIYGSLGFSTNGLITFPSSDTSFLNTDLSAAPAQA